MKRSELQMLILKALTPPLADRGFGAKLADQAFVKPTNSGFVMLHMSFAPHSDGSLAVAAEIGVRFDAAQEILLSGHALSARDRKRSATLGSELGNLTEGRRKVWSIRAGDEIDALVLEIVEDFDKKGIPALEKLESPDEAFNLIISRTPLANAMTGDALGRCKKGVALAHVLGKIEQAEDFISQCRTDLAKLSSPVYLRDFEKFELRLREAETDE